MSDWKHDENHRLDSQALGFEDGRDGARPDPDGKHERAYVRGYEEGMKWVGHQDEELSDDIRNEYTWNARCRCCHG